MALTREKLELEFAKKQAGEGQPFQGPSAAGTAAAEPTGSIHGGSRKGLPFPCRAFTHKS